MSKLNGEPKVKQETTIGTAKPTASPSQSWLDSVGQKALVDTTLAVAKTSIYLEQMEQLIKTSSPLKAFGRRIQKLLYFVVAGGTAISLIILAVPLFLILLPPLIVIYLFKRYILK